MGNAERGTRSAETDGPRPSTRGSADARAKEVFGEAIELSGEARREYLEGACGGDSALRERVDVLLRGAEADDGFLRAVAGASDGSTRLWPGPEGEGAGRAPGQDGGAPREIGPYRIISQLGEGGFGSVYLA